MIFLKKKRGSAFLNVYIDNREEKFCGRIEIVTITGILKTDIRKTVRRMGEKDITEKTLFDYPDVVADAMNVLLFNGKKVVKQDEIIDVSMHSSYKVGEELHEETRDNLKAWRKNGKIIALIGSEQQTDQEKDEPIRIFGYDGAVYLGQVVSRREQNRKRRKNHQKALPAHYVPVLTMVLHYGNRRWKYSTHLKDILDIPEELECHVSDYEMHPVYDISWLTSEQVKMFESDFGIVADYFVQMWMKHRYEPSVKEITHVDAVLKQMTVLTKTDWRSEVIEQMKKEGKEITMVSAYAEVEKRGYERGMAAASSKMKSAYAEVEQRGYERGMAAASSKMKSAYAEVEQRGYEKGLADASGKLKSAYAEVEKRGIEKGIKLGKEQMKSAYAGVEQKGLEKGLRQGREETALNMLKSNRFTLADVAEFSGLSKDEVRKLNGSLSK